MLMIKLQRYDRIRNSKGKGKGGGQGDKGAKRNIQQMKGKDEYEIFISFVCDERSERRRWSGFIDWIKGRKTDKMENQSERKTMH